jgi:hypothetical protein
MVLRPIVIVVLVGVAASAGAWEQASISRVTASVDYELWVDASPSPYCWNYWDGDSTGHPVPSLHHVAEVVMFPCNSGWTVHCDGDGLSWHGWWLEIEPDNYAWNWIKDDAELTCVVYFAEPARLTATRAVTGELSMDVHTVEVQQSDGDPIVMLGDAAGPDAAELDLSPALYTIVLRVAAWEHNTHHAYDGQVHLAWGPQDDTPVLASTWSTVKALYR